MENNKETENRIKNALVNKIVEEILNWEHRNGHAIDNDNTRWAIGELVSVVRDANERQ